MSDQAVLLPKWSPHGGIILAKGWLDHSNTFWTMANYTYYTSTKFADSHVRWVGGSKKPQNSLRNLKMVPNHRIINFFVLTNCCCVLWKLWKRIKLKTPVHRNENTLYVFKNQFDGSYSTYVVVGTRFISIQSQSVECVYICPRRKLWWSQGAEEQPAPHSTLSLPYMNQGVKTLFPLTKIIGYPSWGIFSDTDFSTYKL